MIQETRTIVFGSEDLLKAINSYRQHKTGFLPPGKILYYKTNDGGVFVGIEMTYSGKKDKLDIPVSRQHLLDLLVRFCIENNIVLPARGVKNVSFREGQAVLRIELETEVG